MAMSAAVCAGTRSATIRSQASSTPGGASTQMVSGGDTMKIRNVTITP